jgi:hypothetical protein
MQEVNPGKPIAAVRYEKQRLEALDPRYVVHVNLDTKSETAGLHISPRALNECPHVAFELRKPLTDELRRDFYEKGYPLDVKAKEIIFSDSPILDQLFREVGEDANIRLQQAAIEPGVLQKENWFRVPSS